jgi:hypothetical protein
MKCPHCQASIGLFSDEMKTLGRTRECPRCGAGVEMGLLGGRFTLAFATVAVAAIVLGVSGPLSAGLAGGVGAAFGFGLKRRA